MGAWVGNFDEAQCDRCGVIVLEPEAVYTTDGETLCDGCAGDRAGGLRRAE